MFRTLFSLILFSIIVTPVFAANKLIPKIYTEQDLEKLDYDHDWKDDVSSFKNGILVKVFGNSEFDLICKGFQSLSQNIVMDVIHESETSVGNSQAKLWGGYSVSSYVRQFTIKNLDFINNYINIKKGVDYLNCSESFITNNEYVTIKHDYNFSSSGNISLSNIQSKQIRIVEFGVTEEGMEWFAVIAFIFK
tara:strand:+ start:234 stop:809 length:576 start_codon:yes stop_codon:yes gene_type:complete